MNGGVENGEPNVSYGLTAVDGYTSSPTDPTSTPSHHYALSSHSHDSLGQTPSPGPGADGVSPSPGPGAGVSVQELAALKHAEAMHLACKVPHPLISTSLIHLPSEIYPLTYLTLAHVYSPPSLSPH